WQSCVANLLVTGEDEEDPTEDHRHAAGFEIARSSLMPRQPGLIAGKRLVGPDSDPVVAGQSFRSALHPNPQQYGAPGQVRSHHDDGKERHRYSSSLTKKITAAPSRMRPADRGDSPGWLSTLVAEHLPNGVPANNGVDRKGNEEQGKVVIRQEEQLHRLDRRALLDPAVQAVGAEDEPGAGGQSRDGVDPTRGGDQKQRGDDRSPGVPEDLAGDLQRRLDHRHHGYARGLVVLAVAHAQRPGVG